jgi:cytochrome c-type biogenesis protein CcmH/NrfG
MARSGKTSESSFSDLMQAGRVAYKAGKPRLAHDLWREAAKLQPQNEQVWLALLDVLDSDSDRRVCLQNIIAINPLNVQARRMLNRIEARIERRARDAARQQARQARGRRQRRVLLRRAILLGIAVGLSGIFFGVVLSILLYGG